jgi:hypothetical protein
MNKLIIPAIAALAVVTMACTISINLPVAQVKTGPLETEEIRIPLPEGASTSTNIQLTFGAGELELAPGASDSLLEGQITYNVADFKPEILTSGNRVRIEQGGLNIQGVPSFRDNLRNEWDFRLAETPMSIRIEAGAYKGRFELGGLALEDLEISDGASEVQLTFSEPNLVEMSSLRYTTGASSVTLQGLANANFENMLFRSGAGSYVLDFSGDLKRDGIVTIESGISSLKIIVPRGMNAQVNFEGGLSNIDVDGDWTRSGNLYQQVGTGPTLEFNVKMGAGNIELSTGR